MTYTVLCAFCQQLPGFALGPNTDLTALAFVVSVGGLRHLFAGNGSKGLTPSGWRLLDVLR